MKEALTSFDLMALVAEWQGLVGGYVDKIYQARDEVILRINLPGVERRELYCKAGKWLCLHATEEKPETPPPFAMGLRRARARRQAQSRPAARGTSAACPGCGALAVDDGRFCWKCGTALPAAPPQPSAPPAPPHL